MQTPTVTEISRQSYLAAQKAWHQAQLRRVGESLVRRPESGEKRA
jgi:hypothetical protein